MKGISLQTDLIRDLSVNAGLLSILVIVYGAVTNRSRNPETEYRPASDTFWGYFGGLLCGLVGIVSMLTPVRVADGVIIDIKTVIAALSTAYLPTLPGMLSVAVMGLFRAYMGGAGWIPALVALVLAGAWGAWISQLKEPVQKRFQPVPALWVWLTVFGMGVAAIGLVTTLLLPSGIRLHVLATIAIPVLLVFPLATVSASYLLETSLLLKQREQESHLLQNDLKRALEDTRQFAKIFTNSQDTVVIMKPDGSILDANPAFCEKLEYSRNELIGVDSARFRVDESGSKQFLSEVNDAIRQKGRWQGEILRRKKSGGLFISDITIDGLTDDDGVVRRWVSIGRDMTEKRRMEEEIRKAGDFDPLTGLSNRRLVTQNLRQLLNPEAANPQTPHMQKAVQTLLSGGHVAVCVFDLDNFKSVNDRYGHPAGDKFLRDLAIRLREGAVTGNIIGRLGGDEFVVVLTDFKDVAEVRWRVENIRLALADPVQIDTEWVSLQSSVGVTIFPQDASDEDGLLRHADLALYAAKEAGKNQVAFFDPSKDLEAQARRETIRRTELAIDRGELVLYFQPKVTVQDLRVMGMEALVRWQHPEKGLLSPASFLKEIAGSPIAARLDHWVMQEAFATGSQWYEAGLDISVSININVTTLIDPQFIASVKELLGRHSHFASNFLEIEILETETLNDLSLVAVAIQELVDAGVKVSIDDFGTGYSSLTYLQRLPAQIIKVDQSFVRDMLDDTRDLMLVKGVIGLAKAFQRSVVAEGVESAEQARSLREMGCDALQGYGIARPMPKSAVSDWVKQWTQREGVAFSLAMKEPT